MHFKWTPLTVYHIHSHVHIDPSLYMYRDCAFTSFPLSVNENKWKYTEGVAILSGKNVQQVAVEEHFLLLECFGKNSTKLVCSS